MIVTVNNTTMERNTDMIDIVNSSEILPLNYTYTDFKFHVENDCKPDNYEPVIKNDKVTTVTPHHYWITIGLPESQCCSKYSTASSLADQVEEVKIQNSKFFANFYKNETKIPIWSIDGLCATGKTSMKLDMIKTNMHLNNIAINTHPHNALGYYFSSCKLLKENCHKVSDRTPYNNLYPWISIWHMISDAENNGYTEFESNSYSMLLTEDEKSLVYTTISDETINTWRIFMKLLADSTIDDLVTTTKCIILVDSNEEAARTRLRNRGLKNPTTSDLERSEWSYYIKMQNYAYAFLAYQYPENFCIIDLNKYYSDLSTVQDIVKSIVTEYTIESEPKMMFKDLKSESPMHYLVKEYEDSERIRPYQAQSFYSCIKGVKN